MKRLQLPGRQEALRAVLKGDASQEMRQLAGMAKTETPPRAWGRHQQVVVWNSQNTTYSVLTRFQGFDDELQSRNLDGGLARRADGSNFKAGCVRNRLDEDHARFRRTVLVKVLYNGGCHRIFDARNEDIRPGLDEPQLHAPAHGGWKIICDNDEHGPSPAWQSRPRPPWPASPCRSPFP